MPLSDEQSKQAYDSTLQPEEEQRKYWDVHSVIMLEYTIPRYGTRTEVEKFEMEKATAFADRLDTESYSIEITAITEQEGE